MALWEIRIISQPPVRVEVAEARNLAQEFERVLEVRRTFRQWLFRVPKYWQVTDKVCLHTGVVISVQRLKRSRSEPAANAIGFATKDAQ